MKQIIFLMLSLFLFLISNASTLFVVKGKVLKIEKGYVYIQSPTETVKVLMKNLSKEQAKSVQASQGKSNEISLELLPVAFQKD